MKTFKLVISLLLALALLLGVFSQVNAQGNDCSNDWVHSHTLELPSGFWSPGPHNYEIAGAVASIPFSYYQEFLVTEHATLIRGQAYLRLSGISTSQGIVTEIGTAQDTVMQITFAHLGPPSTTRKQAEAERALTTVQMRWDGGDWVDVSAGSIVRGCAFNGNPGHFQRSWGPKF